MRNIFLSFLLLISFAASAQLELPYSIKVVNPKPLDFYYYNASGVPWATTAAVLAGIPSPLRYRGMSVNVNGLEYWFAAGILDVDLVAKASVGTTYTASNGLTKIGSDFSLGGSFSSARTIHGNYNDLTIDSLGILNLKSFGALNLTSSTTVNLTGGSGSLAISSGGFSVTNSSGSSTNFIGSSAVSGMYQGNGATNTKLVFSAGSTTFNVTDGADANGDMYRRSGGLFSRIPIGSEGDVMTVVSGAPAWGAPSGGGSTYTKGSGIFIRGDSINIGGLISYDTILYSLEKTLTIIDSVSGDYLQVTGGNGIVSSFQSPGSDFYPLAVESLSPGTPIRRAAYSFPSTIGSSANMLIGSPGGIYTYSPPSGRGAYVNSLGSWASFVPAYSATTTNGDMVYRSGGGLVRLAAGTSGYVITSNGAGTAPSYESPAVTLTNSVALTNKSVNGVTLTTGGSATTYLNGAGAYTTPAGGGGIGTVTSVTSANADATVATTTTTPVITVVQAPALRSATTTVNVSSATAPISGQVLTATSSTAATWQTPTGITNGAANNELAKSNGTNLTTSGLFSTTDGNILLGTSGGSGSGRVITSQGSAGDIAIDFATKFSSTTATRMSITGAGLYVNNDGVTLGSGQHALLSGTGLIFNNTTNTSPALIQSSLGNGTNNSGQKLQIKSGTAYSVSGNGNGGDLELYVGAKRLLGTGADGTAKVFYDIDNNYSFRVDGIVGVAVVTASTLTLDESHRGKLIYCKNVTSTAVTVPTTLGVGWNCTIIEGSGAGTVTISSADTIVGGLVTSGDGTKIPLIKVEATVWVGN